MHITGGWSPSPYSNANWIAQSELDGLGMHSGNLDVFFKYEFLLDPSVEPASFRPSMDWMADNSVYEIYVNGVGQAASQPSIPQNISAHWRTPYYSAHSFKASNRATTRLADNWQSGENEILVHVKSGSGFVGFLAQWNTESLCPTDTSDSPPDGSLSPNGDSVTAYGTAGHKLKPNLLIGTANDEDTGNIANLNASGDGLEDDGVTDLSTLYDSNSIYAIDVDVQNTTGSPATLYGWIDFDGDAGCA